MKIAIGFDNAGEILYSAVIEYLQANKIEVLNFGANTDYPVAAKDVARAVAGGVADKGILLCGTGIGVAIAANKVKGIRAAVVHNEFTARATAAHNCSNILCLGGRVIAPYTAALCVAAWLNTPFEGGRHAGRLELIDRQTD